MFSAMCLFDELAAVVVAVAAVARSAESGNDHLEGYFENLPRLNFILFKLYISAFFLDAYLPLTVTFYTTESPHFGGAIERKLHHQPGRLDMIETDQDKKVKIKVLYTPIFGVQLAFGDFLFNQILEILLKKSLHK